MSDAWIRLAHVGMHPDRLRQLLDDSGSPAEIVRAIARGAIRVPDRARAAAKVPAGERHAQLESAGIRFLLRGQADFPASLGGLPDCPFFLFHRESSFSGRAVAIVGTRSCTSYGRRLAEEYGAAVSDAGWTVVSGLARGIDGAAHRGSLLGPTPGIAVLGSGIDVWYPSEHSRLGNEILASGGSVWSESPPGTPPVGWRFPPRNRIISGAAQAVVVVEAGVRGGALITARTALDQGREVCATPGDVGRPSSEGCNLLIRDGAIPVHDAEDLIECLSLAIGQPSRSNNSDRARRSSTQEPVPIGAFLERLDSDPSQAMAMLGGMELAGEVVIQNGMVSGATGTTQPLPGEIRRESEEKKG